MFDEVSFAGRKVLITAGADVLVAGTAVFKSGPSGYAAAIKSLRG